MHNLSEERTVQISTAFYLGYNLSAFMYDFSLVMISDAPERLVNRTNSSSGGMLCRGVTNNLIKVPSHRI